MSERGCAGAGRRAAREASLLVISLSQAMGIASGALATDVVVGNGQPASCTEAALNSAISTVNASGGTITFNCGGAKTINLTSEKVFNNASATYAIDGGGLITLSGQNATRIIFHLGGTLNLRSITLQEGRASGLEDAASGGAIRSDSGGTVLNLTNVTFLNNVTNITGAPTPPYSPFDYGGAAVYTRLGQLTVTSCRFSNNTAINSSGGAIHGRASTIVVTGSTFIANASNGGGFGGAIYVDSLSPAGSNGTLELSHSLFRDNTAYNIGGAFYFFLHVGQNEGVTIDTASFLNNWVVENSGTIPWLPTRGIGGGGVVDGGRVTVLNSTFAGNGAQSSLGGSPGGGLALDKNDTVQITNSTFSGNWAVGADNAAGGGGLVIYNNTLPFQITNSTIAFNHAGFTGGGIQSSTSGVLTNTIVANNTASNPWNIQHQCSAELTNGGGALQFPNVIGAPSSGNPLCANGVMVADPRLAALASNGGVTPTHALISGSAAIDSGSCVVSTDQRGVSRPQGPGCDIGSFEALTQGDLIFADGFQP